jgi:predicted dehydrogenase
MLQRAGLPTRPGFYMKEHSGGGAMIDIGVHILDLTLWFMAIRSLRLTSIAHTELAGAARSAVESSVDVRTGGHVCALANGATLVLEVSWMLHHGSVGEDMQMWLYGTNGGSHWPKCEIYSTNYATQQHLNRTLKLTADKMEPHALECVEFAQAVVEGAPSPVPAEHSLQVQTILDGIYRSQQTGGEVRLG